MSIFGPGRIITTNATVDIEPYQTAIGDDGGTVYTYAPAIVTGVPVLFTLHSGSRDGSYGTDAQRDSGTISGVEPQLNRADIRLKVASYDENTEYVGTYWRVTAFQRHPNGRGGLLKYRITLQVEQLDMPIQIPGE